MTSYRYALVVEYDGSFFAGWQRQDQVPSVQERLEKALFCLTQHKASIQGAGRTDAGVHAIGQVAHCDLPTLWPLYKLQQGMNFYLRDQGVVVSHVCTVDSNFHARFSAQKRIYRYTIVNRSSPPLFLHGQSWWIAKPLCIQTMNDACALLCGTHDFSSFRYRDCQSLSPIKTLDTFYIQHQPPLVIIHARAQSFLHRQVRMMVGALAQVGQGKWDVDHVRSLIDNPSPQRKSPAAPACGLCLTEVQYNEDLFA